jgi:hypothetical protein
MRHTARRIHCVIIATVAAASFLAIVPIASAAGTSPKTNGCYAQWWNTAFSGYCTPATATGWFRIFADCSWPQVPDVTGPWRYITKGSTVRPFDSRECAYGIHYAQVQFKGA